LFICYHVGLNQLIIINVFAIVAASSASSFDEVLTYITPILVSLLIAIIIVLVCYHRRRIRHI